MADSGWRTSRPVTSKTDHNVHRVRNVVNSDGRLSVYLIENQVDIDKMTPQLIITEDLGIRKICAKFAPKKAN